MAATIEIPSAGKTVEIYSRYLPDLILEKVGAVGALEGATGERFTCAVMFADISGFTPLTQRLAAEGSQGAEKLTRILNGYFSRLIELVDRHGGDILKFAGDSLIAIWRADDEAGLARAAWLAARCGLQTQDALRDYRTEGVPLTLRVAIGAGPAVIAHLGGELERWEFIISGRPWSRWARFPITLHRVWWASPIPCGSY